MLRKNMQEPIKEHVHLVGIPKHGVRSRSRRRWMPDANGHAVTLQCAKCIFVCFIVTEVDG